MVFWKSLFSTTEVPEAAKKAKMRRLPGYEEQIYFSTDKNIDIYELEELCDAVGWSRRPVHKVRKALQYSFVVGSLWYFRGSFQRLIGFARATSDHAFNATIWDVAVHPEFQNRGLGRALMTEMIAELQRADISNISLFADAHVVEFYRRLGFNPDPEGIKGMFLYN